MRTNQINPTFYFSNINRDFWIYRFAESSPDIKVYNHTLLDELKHKLHANAVVYVQGKFFYALFDKKNFKDVLELEKCINPYRSDTLLANRLDIHKNRDTKETIDDCHLAQLLFNSLAVFVETKKTHFNNITGGLYYVVRPIKQKPTQTKNVEIDISKKEQAGIIWKYVTLKIELDYYRHLGLKVNTFSNTALRKFMTFEGQTKFEDLPKYEIVSSTRKMRKLSHSEVSNKIKYKDSNVFVLRQTGDRETIEFLNFSELSKFQESKCGILYEFLKDVQDYLGDYIKVDFNTLPQVEDWQHIVFDDILSSEVKAKIKKFYQNTAIVISIADSLKEDADAQRLADNLKHFLTDDNRDYKAKKVTIGALQKEAINIKIIRNKSFYSGNNMHDEYSNLSDFIIHHITLDDFMFELFKTKKGEKIANKTSPAITNTLKECYIKNDLLQKKITIIDWVFGEWIFVSRDEIKEDTKKSDQEQRKEKRYSYQVMKVYSDGSFDFECYEDIDDFIKYQKHINHILPYLKNDNKHIEERNKFKALIISEDGDVNFIEDTPKFTIQEIEKIGEVLELANQETDFTKEQVVELIDMFIAEIPKFANDKRILNARQSVLGFRNRLKKSELNDIFNKVGISNRTDLKKCFSKYYVEKSENVFGIKDVLSHFFRGSDMKAELFNSKINIYYQKDDIKPEAMYFVGETDKKGNPINEYFHNATNIRKVKAVPNLDGQNSELVFEKLLPTMNVDFVKQGELTVLPFPFKYLRELARLSNKKLQHSKEV